MIDTHCHIDQFPSPLAVARATEKRRITTIAVTNLPSHYELALPHLCGFRYVRPSLGLHPLAAQNHRDELPAFLRLAQTTRFIGEVGLDFTAAGRETRDVQLASFRRVAEALSGGSYVVTVHSRGAETQVLDVLRENGAGPVIFHWFTGHSESLRSVIDAGHFLSVNTAMAASRKWKELFDSVPRDRILTETDGPHARYAGRPAEPSDVAKVLDWVARQWRIDRAEAESLVAQNLNTLLQKVNVGLQI